ncbi:alpha/beta fold hydrolase [[Limnothrix rosea] IAM M-220]|uniref:alpha/beta fold hydrolase n=1 Tax=[Limnothrix rosea] IAM M-220 TaxID=454133 RepID=UPI000961992B|nr:alpha/beta hydrolase [[Limnothrix rosea] IAM M-220]OKH17784.1 alpha/beta hydrolase [[Limnothrix rosea] IAM M-220]
MAKVEVRGVSHYFEWLQQDSSETKPTMLFVHGWGGSSQYWQETARQFSAQYDCLIYDLKGFGRSPLPANYQGDFALQEYALDLAELIRALNISTPLVLNAHSMGASIAALFTEKYPEQVERLILNCNGVFSYNERAFAIFQKIGKGIVKFRFPWLAAVPFMDRIAIARFLKRPINKGDRQQFLADYLAADGAAAAGTLVAAVNKDMVTRLPAAFKQIQCPTLFLSGENDQIIPAEQAKAAIALNPNFQYTEIPGVGHFPMLESPDIYQQQIQQFLGR